ncbi:MAG: hypothetical protein RL346_402 [Verrucomicrobiota bacterium]|jgi:peroxiredoxin Q/BCP
MKPKAGEQAPEFRAMAVESGKEYEVALSDLKGQRVVLVFYPKDHTPGCTVQACALRDEWSEIANKAKVFSVSADSVESHRDFISKQGLPYPLIADVDKRMVNDYGVWVEKTVMGQKVMGIERSTFIIGADGIIEAVMENVSPATHSAELIKLLG